MCLYPSCSLFLVPDLLLIPPSQPASNVSGPHPAPDALISFLLLVSLSTALLPVSPFLSFSPCPCPDPASCVLMLLLLLTSPSHPAPVCVQLPTSLSSSWSPIPILHPMFPYLSPYVPIILSASLSPSSSQHLCPLLASTASILLPGSIHSPVPTVPITVPLPVSSPLSCSQCPLSILFWSPHPYPAPDPVQLPMSLSSSYSCYPHLALSVPTLFLSLFCS